MDIGFLHLETRSAVVRCLTWTQIVTQRMRGLEFPNNETLLWSLEFPLFLLSNCADSIPVAELRSDATAFFLQLILRANCNHQTRKCPKGWAVSQSPLQAEKRSKKGATSTNCLTNCLPFCRDSHMQQHCNNSCGRCRCRGFLPCRCRVHHRSHLHHSQGCRWVQTLMTHEGQLLVLYIKKTCWNHPKSADYISSAVLRQHKPPLAIERTCLLYGRLRLGRWCLGLTKWKSKRTTTTG